MTAAYDDSVDEAETLADRIDAIAAVHALLPQLAATPTVDGFQLPPREQLRRAYEAASPRARSLCRTRSLRLAETARDCTAMLTKRCGPDQLRLAPAAMRLRRELGTGMTELCRLLPL